MPTFKCVSCSRNTDSASLDVSCEHCGSAVLLEEGNTSKASRASFEKLPPGVWRYKEFLPAVPPENLVSLGEGGTPLLKSLRLGSSLGLGRLLIKDETRNPTGSFIDRGSTVLVSLAKSRGLTSCSCSTTGNLGASLAAYCAKAGVSTRIALAPGADRGKLYQMIAYGADVEPAQASGGRPLGDRGIAVSARNPYILEGEKTTAFEIVQDLGWKVPDVIMLPVGTGGHISMISRGLRELKEAGLVAGGECRLIGVQVGGRQPPDPSATLTELEESEPFFKKEAARAIKESRGASLFVDGAQTIRATGLLARTEGIFAEPASASVVAGMEVARSRQLIDASESVVCVVTGAGLKDTKAISRTAKAARQVAVNDEYAVARVQVGETKITILRLLKQSPVFGYGVWKALLPSRRITTASVYQHLGELEHLGLVRRSGIAAARGRERILYELTERGSHYLRMAEQIQGASTSRPPGRG